MHPRVVDCGAVDLRGPEAYHSLFRTVTSESDVTDEFSLLTSSVPGLASIGLSCKHHNGAWQRCLCVYVRHRCLLHLSACFCLLLSF